MVNVPVISNYIVRILVVSYLAVSYSVVCSYFVSGLMVSFR